MIYDDTTKIPNQNITQVFTVVQLATLLKQLAGAIRLSAFRKKRRGPKKPSVKKPYNAQRPHVSTAKALAAAAAK